MSTVPTENRRDVSSGENENENTNSTESDHHAEPNRIYPTLNNNAERPSAHYNQLNYRTEYDRQDFYRGNLHNETLRAKEALELVPIFDGHNLPVEEFCINCLDAINFLAPGSEPLFRRLLATRLSGNAKFRFGNKLRNYAAIEDFLSDIKDAYKCGRDFSYWINEITKVYMERGENVEKYATRVERLYNQAEVAIQHGSDSRETKLSKQDQLEETAIRHFINGLTYEIKLELRLIKPRSLHEAITLARQLEIDYNNDLKIEETRNNKTQAIGNRASIKWMTRTNPGNAQNYPQMHCDFCNRTSHTTQECHARIRNSLYCTYCKIPGHTFEECRNKLRNNYHQTNTGNANNFSQQQNPISNNFQQNNYTRRDYQNRSNQRWYNNQQRGNNNGNNYSRNNQDQQQNQQQNAQSFAIQSYCDTPNYMQNNPENTIHQQNYPQDNPSQGQAFNSASNTNNPLNYQPAQVNASPPGQNRLNVRQIDDRSRELPPSISDQVLVTEPRSLN